MGNGFFREKTEVSGFFLNLGFFCPLPGWRFGLLFREVFVSHGGIAMLDITANAKAIYWCVLLGVSVFAVGCGDIKKPPGSGPKPSPVVIQPDLEVLVEDLVKNGWSQGAAELVKDLVKNGWPQGTAEKVVDLNATFYQAAKVSDPALLTHITTVLARLGDRHDVLACVEKVPAIASLLGYSINKDPEGPEKIAKTIPLDPGKDQEAVLNLYSLFCTPDESIRLSEVLSSDRELVLRLWNRGELGAIPWLASGPKGGEARETYHRWVREIYQDALVAQATDEGALARANGLMQIHSGMVGKLMEKGQLTPQQFEAAWAAFQKLLQAKEKDDLEWGVFCCDPRVWEFHRDFNGREWGAFERVGSQAIDISKDPAFVQCRQEVLLAVAKGNQWIMEALRDPVLQGQPLFAPLLCRGLDNDTLCSALNALSISSPQVKIDKLKYWAGLSKEALARELGPPPAGPVTWLPGYSLMDLIGKKMDGRETTWLDLAFAGVDAAEVAFMIKGASKGLKLVQQGLAKQLAVKGLQNAAIEITEKSSRNLFPWVLRETYSMAAKKMRSVAEYGMVDVTDVVRFAFEKTRMGNQAFSRITKLDARVFMRTDRRVIFDVPHLVSSKHVIGRGLMVTGEGAVVEGALSTPAGQKAVETGVIVGKRILENTEEQTRAWKKNLSIWWVAINHDGLQKP